MSIKILILVALGSAVVGVLFSFLFFNIYQRFQKKRQALFQKDANLIMTRTAKQPVATMVKVGISKPNGHKADTFEILLKNHKNRIILENYQKSPKFKLNVPEEQNTSVAEGQKQSSEPSVLSQKSITIKGTPKESLITNALQGQTTVDRKNTPTSVSQIESRQPGVIKGPEIINQKSIPIIRKTMKSSEPSALKGRETPKQKSTLTIEEPKQSLVQDVTREPEIISPKIPPIEVRQNESPQSDIIQELETNLAIATTPWANKLLPFQTSCWDSNHAEGEPLLTSHVQDLIELYVDIGLTNNIVWMATEFGHRSKELDESYIKLCTSIAERIKKITSFGSGLSQVFSESPESGKR